LIIKIKLAQFVFVAWLCTTPFVRGCSAAVSYVGSPTFSPTLITAPTIDFEGYPDGTVANLLFQNQGITFSRDDGNSITIVDGKTTGLVPFSNLLWTGSSPPTEGSLEIQSAIPLYAIGAYIGSSGFTQSGNFFSLTAFDSTGHLLGSVLGGFGFPSAPFALFAGLQSDTPFSRVRFDSPLGAGTTAAVPFFLDDLRFSSVPIPEPRSLTLLWLGFSLMLGLGQPKVFYQKARFHTNWRRDGRETRR